MNPEQKSVEQFFNDLPKEDKKIVDIFEEPKADAKTEEKKEEAATLPEKDDEPRKNRRHRRLEQQLQEERELRIAAEARAEGRSEAQRFSSENSADEVDPRWLTIYGDTKEARQAWKLQQEIISDYAEKSKEEVRRELQEEQAQASKYEKEFESFIDNQLESIEDEYNVDITSNSPQARKMRSELIDMVEALSPKDEDGLVTNYADFKGAFEMYQLKNTKTEDNSRQREIASRSMASSSGVPNTDKATEDATLDYLRKIGIRI